VIIRALSVFEGIVYHCYAVDTANPCRVTLEVEAVVREGDVDAGPLLVSVADWAVLAGGPEVVQPCLDRLRRQGRVTDHLGAPYLSFPTWTPVDLEHR
jgi:hypothetical protein